MVGTHGARPRSRSIWCPTRFDTTSECNSATLLHMSDYDEHHSYDNDTEPAYVGYRNGRVVAHFLTSYEADSALVRQVVDAYSPINPPRTFA